MRKRTKAREYALQILYQLELTGQTLDEVLVSFWEDHGGDAEIVSFTERIARGTVEHMPAIDEILKKYSENWNLNRMACIDRNILRFATFEILFMQDIPPKVSINEAVNLAKSYSQQDSGKFVNGVLDKINHTEQPIQS